ncbi:methyltransferase domain-containing protein [Paeniglutamicibacter kerguelensis]|uniref:Trans-aconitate methyltransferase n=1 Tax=Paeniglutamicibacter kerguelensis TaxID=254788 RepID=A0ABS4XDD5_9MICC|nr:methyltransferase domain-containing protein [Paeniglutamicibacter kerguelensis]MBP2386480.1 trans-aconitate methyltransferase [Paeniglutamicibacter kerguelensis]
MKWDPEKYVQFADHRDRPFFDLTARVAAEAPRLVVDLGCGPGPLTRSLAERWPEARVVGLDSSHEMVQKARSTQRAPGLEFELADSERWAPRLAGVLRHKNAVGEPEGYLKILLAAGFEADVWETTYGQVLTGENPVLEWVRGTALRPILAKLDAVEAAEFEADYARLVAQAYPSFEGTGGVLLTMFPFRRIFMVGRKR